ncbi:hypothetical protein AAY473_030996 [Plecturocebus cupreus]
MSAGGRPEPRAGEEAGQGRRGAGGGPSAPEKQEAPRQRGPSGTGLFVKMGRSQPRFSALLQPQRRLLSGARGSPGSGAGERQQPDREPLSTCPSGGAAMSQAAAAAAPSGEGK